MAHSYAETVTFTCANCGRDFDAEFWLIVDTSERPDLVERIRTGTLHDVTCLRCGNPDHMDAPLLLCRPGAEPAILFSPAEETTSEKDNEQALQLIEILCHSLDDAWRDEWQNVLFVPRSLLPPMVDAQGIAPLSQDDLATWALALLDAALSEQRQELILPQDPLTHLALVKAMENLASNEVGRRRETAAELANSLRQVVVGTAFGEGSKDWLPLSVLQGFVFAPTWDESRRMIEQHPILLDEEADQALSQLIETARNLGDTLTHRRDLLRRCREVGTAQAFAEQLLPPDILAIAQAHGMAPEDMVMMQKIAQMPREFLAMLPDLTKPVPRTEMAQRIQLYRRALTLLPRDLDPQLWAETQSELGRSLADSLSGDRGENIEDAITAYQQALEVVTRDAMPEKWALIMNNLAVAYYFRIKGDRAENYESSIDCCQQALQVRKRQAMPAEWAQTMMNLANAYSDRICGDREENIEQAIAAYEQALEITTQQSIPVEWARIMLNLAIAFKNRIRGDRAENIEKAIGIYQLAFRAITPADMPHEWLLTTVGLANTYVIRIRGNSAENIEQAIAAYEQALEVATRDAMPFEWAQAKTNCASAYLLRIWGDRAENVKRAIAYCEQALEVRTRETMQFEWAETMMSLATAYMFETHNDNAENIDKAIIAYQQALEVRTRLAMPVDWAKIMLNLAAAHVERTSFLAESHRAESIEQACAFSMQAMEVITRQAMPVDWAKAMMNLGEAYTLRVQGNRTSNIEEAILAYQQALEIFVPEQLPHDCIGAGRRLAELCFAEKRYADVADPFRLAMQAVDNLLRESYGRASDELALGRIQGLSAKAAYANAVCEKLDKAVESLELGRARLLATAMEQNRRDLERLAELGHKDLLDRYKAVSQHITDLQAQVSQSSTGQAVEARSPHAFAALSLEIRVARRELDAIVSTIRQVPGYENLFVTPTFEKVKSTITTNVPLVYLLTTSAGGLALVVHASRSQIPELSKVPQVSVDAVWLDNFDEAKLDAILFNVGDEGRYLVGAFLGDDQALRRSLDETLPVLGQTLMGPLATHLESLDVRRVTLIPTGRLALLPLHAAVLEDGAAFHDRFETAYAPSASALLHSQAPRAEALLRFLAVGNPTPTNQLDTTLLFPQLLVDEVSAKMDGSSMLVRSAATVTAVQDALARNPAHVLFGCHGVFEVAEPLQSGLELADGRLTLAQLLDNVRLPSLGIVVLCACQSSLSDFRKLPDEVVGLPTGFLQAGVQAVVGALWPVSALPTVLMLRRFYDLLLSGTPPAASLREASAWLRSMDHPSFKREVAELHRLADPPTAFELKKEARRFTGPYPFASPIYWAAFTYNGALTNQGDHHD